MKRNTPPGWTAIWAEGGNDSFTPCKGTFLWGTVRSEIGQRGGIDLPTDGKSPAQGYGKMPPLADDPLSAGILVHPVSGSASSVLSGVVICRL